MMVCECGEIIEKEYFRCYINTSLNPSTATVGHTECGVIFNFFDTGPPKKYSSKKELKVKVRKYAERKKLDNDSIQRVLLEVDRLKRKGDLNDFEIVKRVMTAFNKSIPYP